MKCRRIGGTPSDNLGRKICSASGWTCRRVSRAAIWPYLVPYQK